jgi:MATE family multidrug resistance protein
MIAERVVAEHGRSSVRAFVETLALCDVATIAIPGETVMASAPALSAARTDIADEVRATIRLALPLIAAQLAVMGENVVLMVLAGHLGAHVLGVVAVGSNVVGLAFMTIIGVMMALSPSVAQLDGARRRIEVAPLFCQALWLALVAGLSMQAVIYAGGPSLVRAFGVDATLVDDITGFLNAFGFALPPISLYFACRGLSEGLSLTRPTMYFNVLSLALLAPAGYVLMYPMGLGAFGCGIAAAAVAWLQLGAFVIFLLVSPRYRGLGWQEVRLAPDLAAIAGLLRIGAPMAISVVMEIGLFTAAALALGRLGGATVGGHQIALSVSAVTYMVPLGLAMAITVRVGNAVGRGDAAGARRAGLVGIGLTLVSQSVSCALLLGLPGPIASIYSSDPEVLSGAVLLLHFAAAFQFSDGIQVASNGALRGLKDARIPMLITGFSYWCVGMPVGWYFAFSLNLRAPGMWIGLIAGLSVAAALLFSRFFLLSREVSARP